MFRERLWQHQKKWAHAKWVLIFPRLIQKPYEKIFIVLGDKDSGKSSFIKFILND